MAIETDLAAIYIRLVTTTRGGCADKAEPRQKTSSARLHVLGFRPPKSTGCSIWRADLCSPFPLGEFEADHALGRSLNEERSAYRFGDVPQVALEHLFAELLSAGEADGKH